MSKRRLLAMILAVGATGLPITGAVAGEVNVGINIGVPAPPRIVLPAPPPVVVVPNSPVSYVPSVDFNLFVYPRQDEREQTPMGLSCCGRTVFTVEADTG